MMASRNRNVLLVGFFAYSRGAQGDKRVFGGQTAKCRMLHSWLGAQKGVNLAICDTYQWRKRAVVLFSEVVRRAKQADCVIVALSENGLKFFLPLLLHLKRRYGFRLGYVVIGGWVADRCCTHPRFKAMLMKLDAVFAETVYMVDELESQGICNVSYVPNSKQLEPLGAPDSIDLEVRPFPLCTFSRVCEEKGISTAIESVARINELLGKRFFHLDVYGPIAADYYDKFKTLISDHSDCAEYKGSIEAGESVKVLRRYLLLLLLPTRYIGEGFPGTIVDAFSSGVPVLTSGWHNASSIIGDGRTGIIYDFNDPDGCFEALKRVAANPSRVIAMREKCLEESKKYTPDVANRPIATFLDATDATFSYLDM